MSLVLHLYDLLACLALISSAFVCVVVHVTKGTRFGAMVIHSGTVWGPPLLCCLSDLPVHINGKGVVGAVTFTATLSQSARP